MSRYNNPRRTVTLSDLPDGRPTLGVEVVLDENGKLPDVIILDTFVFGRDSETCYSLRTAAHVLSGFGYAVPMKRIYHEHPPTGDGD